MVGTEIDIGYIATVIAVILLSMTLHEAMHGYVAYWLGDDTAKSQGRLTLNPLRHLDPFLSIILPVALALAGMPIFGGAKPVPFNSSRVRYGEWGAALVALAGPLTNFILAFFFFGVWVLVGHPPAGFGTQALLIAVYVNLGFFVFNMIPIPPLDGSRVLYALAPESVRRAMELVERYGIILVFALVLIAGPYIGQFMSGAIMFFFEIFLDLFHIF